MGTTKIEWTDNTWSPITGCSPISPGCQNCWAKRMALRLRGRHGYPKDDPFKITFHEDRFTEPFHWKKPRRIFVCSMGDLFHESVPFEWIDKVFAVAALCPQHTFQILTKRPENMKAYIDILSSPDWAMRNNFALKAVNMLADESNPDLQYDAIMSELKTGFLPNVWLGVTAENQEQADKRIPILLQCPAAVRFVSIEPMLGPVDLFRFFAVNTGNFYRDLDESCHRKQMDRLTGRSPSATIEGLDWVIVGGETGPGARPIAGGCFKPVREIRNQCNAAGVPFFYKGHGTWGNCKKGMIGPFGYRAIDGREWNEFPEVKK